VRKGAPLWLNGGRLTLEHAGQGFSLYDVEQGPGGRLTVVAAQGSSRRPSPSTLSAKPAG
jgi:hypothetical protein